MTAIPSASGSPCTARTWRSRSSSPAASAPSFPWLRLQRPWKTGCWHRATVTTTTRRSPWQSASCQAFEVPPAYLQLLQCYTQGTMMSSLHESPDRADPTPSTDCASAAAEGGRRDRKKQATRQALRSAALELVAERGFAHVTIEDIAEAADVATRTFFNYFPSKESAVIGADPERIEELRTSLLTRPLAESPLQALRSVTVEYAAA